MLNLVLLSKLILMFCLLEGLVLFLNISTYVGFSVFSVYSVIAAIICPLGLYFKLLNFWIFVDVGFFSLILHLICFLCLLIFIHSFLTVVWAYLWFGPIWLVSLIVLSQKEMISSIKFNKKSFRIILYTKMYKHKIIKKSPSPLLLNLK